MTPATETAIQTTSDMIGKILNYFGLDGMAHILVCLVLCSVLSAFIPIWAAVLITAFVGAAKEVIYDMWMKRGNASWKDALCDGIGIALGALSASLYNL